MSAFSVVNAAATSFALSLVLEFGQGSPPDA
jgi:hypothetical protein